MTDIDLTFYPLRTYQASWHTFPVQPEAWVWLSYWPTFPSDLATIDILTSAGWVKVGSFRNQSFAFWPLSSQLSNICVLEAKDEQGQRDDYLWIPAEDKTRLESLPVVLAFTLSPEQRKQPNIKTGGKMKSLVAPQTLPPANLGEVGIILTGEDDALDCKRCPIGKLPYKSQELQQRMGAALSHLASAHKLERSAWLEQWREIQAMARQLAADYWHTYQDSQIKRPQPINIWKLRQGEGALAAMTMVQDGAHASINNKDKWEQIHMIHHGPQQGIMLPRYIHTHTAGETEYWIQHPEEVEAPVDPDLVSQEVLKQQTKLDDLEADLVTLAPIYLLAKGEEEVALSPEQLLRDLGIQPKFKDGYSAGYRPEELQRVISAFERLSWLRIKTRQSIYKSRGRKPALITAEAPYLIITEWLWQDPLLDGTQSRKLLGWKYQITWLKQFTGDTEAGKQLGVLLKKSFTFRQDQHWEKRLSRYLTIHLCVAAHKGQASINCIIRNLMEHCGLVPTERDRAHPTEYAKQFESAMDHLKQIGVIGDWQPKTNRETDLPKRAWLDLWLDSSCRVTQAPTALEAGYQKMIDAAQQRHAALPASQRGKKKSSEVR